MAHYEPPHQDLRCLLIQLFTSLVLKELNAKFETFFMKSRKLELGATFMAFHTCGIKLEINIDTDNVFSLTNLHDMAFLYLTQRHCLLMHL